MTATWTTRGGEVIPVAQMGDQHLINTLRLLERHAEARYEHDLTILICADPGGEMAQDAVAHELATLEAMTPLEYLAQRAPVYKALVWHARRRGLEWRS